MNHTHQTLFDTEAIMDNFCDRGQAVGRAGRVRDLMPELARPVWRKLPHTTVYSGLYWSKFTPHTNMGASAEGAEIITLFAPAFKCGDALWL